MPNNRSVAPDKTLNDANFDLDPRSLLTSNRIEDIDREDTKKESATRSLISQK